MEDKDELILKSEAQKAVALNQDINQGNMAPDSISTPLCNELLESNKLGEASLEELSSEASSTPKSKRP